MMEFAHELVLAGIALVIGAISWVLRKEHSRLEALEAEQVGLNERLSTAVKNNAMNEVADREWRKRVEENHKGLLKADEDRRGDARKIYDKIEEMKAKLQAEIQRLAEKIAGK
jgi:hypothetical protein